MSGAMDDDSLRSMLMAFRLSELNQLLDFAGVKNKAGRKSELQVGSSLTHAGSLIYVRRTWPLSGLILQYGLDHKLRKLLPISYLSMLMENSVFVYRTFPPLYHRTNILS